MASARGDTPVLLGSSAAGVVRGAAGCPALGGAALGTTWRTPSATLESYVPRVIPLLYLAAVRDVVRSGPCRRGQADHFPLRQVRRTLCLRAQLHVARGVGSASTSVVAAIICSPRTSTLATRVRCAFPWMHCRHILGSCRWALCAIRGGRTTTKVGHVRVFPRPARVTPLRGAHPWRPHE